MSSCWSNLRVEKKIADIREGNQETLGLRSNVFENLQMYFYKQIDWCKFDFLLLFLTSFLSSTNKAASKPRNYFIAPSISRYSTYRVGSKFLIFMPFFSIFRPFFLTETSYYFTGLCIQPEVENGMVNIISESGSVLVANVTCNSEYQLVGKKVIKCARGVWSSKAPICTRKFPFNLINLAFSCQICLATPFWLGFWNQLTHYDLTKKKCFENYVTTFQHQHQYKPINLAVENVNLKSW